MKSEKSKVKHFGALRAVIYWCVPTGGLVDRLKLRTAQVVIASPLR